MRTRTSLIVLLLALFLVGCGPFGITGSGRVSTESRNVSNFDAVALACSGELTITQGETESLTIEAEDNLLPYIESDVHGGRLTLGFKPGSYSPTRPIRFNLTLKKLSALDLSGSGSIQAASIQSDRLDIQISGSGDIRISRLQASALTFHLSGSGSLEAAGQVAQQEITISGSGEYRAGDLDSQEASVRISGSGDATLWVRGSLNVTISGSGNVSYYGSPQVDQDISGSGGARSLGSK